MECCKNLWSLPRLSNSVHQPVSHPLNFLTLPALTGLCYTDFCTHSCYTFPNCQLHLLPISEDINYLHFDFKLSN